MATAVINKAPPVIQPPDTVTLTLSMEEAQMVMFLSGSVLGQSDGPRGICDSVHMALQQSDVHIGKLFASSDRSTITFKPN